MLPLWTYSMDSRKLHIFPFPVIILSWIAFGIYPCAICLGPFAEIIPKYAGGRLCKVHWLHCPKFNSHTGKLVNYCSNNQRCNDESEIKVIGNKSILYYMLEQYVKSTITMHDSMKGHMLSEARADNFKEMTAFLGVIRLTRYGRTRSSPRWNQCISIFFDSTYFCLDPRRFLSGVH